MGLEQRFLSKVIWSPGCWGWSAGMKRDGYTKFSSTTGHRIAYRLYIGPIPAGLQIDHLCNNPGCVNPEHLEAVTFEENMRRMSDRMTHCKRGHALTPHNTYYRKDRGVKRCKACTAHHTRAWRKRQKEAMECV